MQEATLSDTVRTSFEEKPAPFAGTAVSDGSTNRFALFVGPKDVDLLKRINPKLEQVVGFRLAVLPRQAAVPHRQLV